MPCKLYGSCMVSVTIVTIKFQSSQIILILQDSHRFILYLNPGEAQKKKRGQYKCGPQLEFHLLLWGHLKEPMLAQKLPHKIGIYARNIFFPFGAKFIILCDSASKKKIYIV